MVFMFIVAMFALMLEVVGEVVMAAAVVGYAGQPQPHCVHVVPPIGGGVVGSGGRGGGGGDSSSDSGGGGGG